VPRAFLVHSYSLIALLRRTSPHSAPAESPRYGIETARMWTRKKIGVVVKDMVLRPSER
jgi:hypothetical protein